MTTANPARPKHSVGDTVKYLDRHDRIQEGEILQIEASWWLGDGRKPFITYRVRHPTYFGRVAIVAETGIYT